MSGIYIKNMEIPTSCVDCTLEQEGGWCGANLKIKDVHRGHKVSDRHKDCPLIPVPDHGRLIDADALKVSLAFAKETASWAVPALRAVLMVIDEMPTIIPAKEET